LKVRTARLGDVLRPDLQPVAVVASATYSSAGLLNRGRGLFRKAEVAGDSTSYKTLYRLSEGQVVYSKLFGWEGAVAVVPSEFAGLHVSSEFPTFAIDSDSVSIGYLRQYLRSQNLMTAVAAATTGLGQRRQRVNPTSFLALPVPLPSREEQDRIATYLNSIERALSRRSIEPVTSRVRGPRSADVIEQLISSAAFDAERAPVGTLLERDRAWIHIDERTTYQPVGVRGFGRGMIRYPTIPGSALSKLRYYRLVPGSLLVSNIKAWEGAVCVVEPGDVERIASNRFLQYRSLVDPFVVAWLHRYFLTPTGVAQLGAASPGSADRNRTLSMESFEAIEVPLPSLELREKVARAGAVSDRLVAVAAQRDALRAALLPAARNEIFAAMA